MREIDLIKTACGGCLEVAGMQRLRIRVLQIFRNHGQITGYVSVKQIIPGKTTLKNTLRSG